jgi:hypothetical protein
MFSSGKDPCSQEGSENMCSWTAQLHPSQLKYNLLVGQEGGGGFETEDSVERNGYTPRG